MKPGVSYGEAPTTGLDYMTCEISYGGRWVNLNDHLNYQISGDATRDSAQKQWRKITAQSPVLGGTYLIHAVPEMVTENVAIFCYGQDQTELQENVVRVMQLFEQMDYQLRWTFNEMREYWHCQLAECTISRNHVWTHNMMASIQFQVPRFPDVTSERI